jgi:hypothetical protein
MRNRYELPSFQGWGGGYSLLLQGITCKERDRAAHLTTPHKKIGTPKIALLAFADLKILDSRLADDGKTTIQTATKSH